MEWAVNGDNIALRQHLLEVINTSAANLLLDLGFKWLVIVVEELLAVEWLQSAEDTLANSANGNCSNDLSFEIVLVLGHSGHVPVTRSDLLVCGDEVADEGEDGHDDVLSDRHDIATSHFSDSDTAVGSVGSVEIDMVRPDTSCDGQLEVLGLG